MVSIINNKNKSYCTYLFRILKIQFCTVPYHTFFILIIILFEAIGLTARTIATQNLFDAIIQVANGKKTFVMCLTPIIVMGVITLTQQALNGFKFFYWTVITDKASGKNKSKLFKKLQKISPELFEDTVFLDDLNKAKEGIRPLTSVALNILNVIFFDITYAVTLGFYLFKLCPVLILMLVLAFVPAVISQTIRIKKFSKLEKESAPIRRENDYYKKVIVDREYYKETRVLGAYDYFNKRFIKTLKLLIHKQWHIEKITTFYEIGLNLLTFIGMGLSIIILFISTMNGNISVAAFAAIFASLSTIFDIMQSMMSWDIACISNDIGKVVNYIYVMDLDEIDGIDGEKSKTKMVIANNINYKYPAREHNSITDVSLEIKDGETIAIVGENGSGKSTLVRLLTGIYRPIEGNVIVDGLDTKKYNLESIHKDVSGVFQSFQKYKLTLFDNIVISEIRKSDQTNESINYILKQSGVEHLLEQINYDTILSPEFGGVDLSGGQWQRLAIARGIYRTNNFIVLDEPTAAIDPIEEDKVFSQFKSIIKGKNSIVVTHRLGSTRFVNKIVVLDKGKIVDIGTHSELLSRPGKYADLWNAQAKWYRREKV